MNITLVPITKRFHGFASSLHVTIVVEVMFKVCFNGTQHLFSECH